MRPPEAPGNMLLAMSIFALLCIGLGVYPQPLYHILPFAVSYEPYSAAHLVAQFQLLLFAGLAFFVMLPMMKRTLTISLDFDWFYRYFFKHLGLAVVSQSRKARFLWAALYHMVTSPFKSIRKIFMSSRYANYHLAESWPTGSMVFWISATLAAFLLLDLLGLGA